MNKCRWNKQISVIMVLLVVMLSGCNGVASANPINVSDANASGSYCMTPVERCMSESTYVYEDAGTIQEKTATFSSDDGLCVIDVYPSYYDVTLDYENGSHEAVGTAYAATIQKMYAEYADVLEPYIYENIRVSFAGQDISFEALEERMWALFFSLPLEYQEEMDAFAKQIAQGELGFTENGVLSYEEVILVQMIPDALRGTACSALSLWGDKTVTGEGITLRCLEWSLGSENQMCKIQAVTHMNHGDKTITSIGMLGLFGIISGVNEDGVFAAILDVGSEDAEAFVYEEKTCYTYAVRYALEEYDTATEVGTYMVEHSEEFTFCHNLIVTDRTNSYCAEDCVSQVSETGDGYSILRDADTPLMPGLTWDCEDSLCVVNSFASEGNQDSFTNWPGNIIRFNKYHSWVLEREQFSIADVKNMITQESLDYDEVQTVHRPNVVQIILVDYATGDVQVAFTGEEGVVEKPEFIDIGQY